MTFSWEKSKNWAVAKAIYRAKIQAKSQHPDYKNRYPQEARDAGKANPDFTELVKRVTKEMKDKQQKAIDRRLKNHGKQN